MTQLPKETQKNGTNKSKSTNEQAKHKPRLSIEKHSRPNRAVWTGPGSCAHGKLPC